MKKLKLTRLMMLIASTLFVCSLQAQTPTSFEKKAYLECKDAFKDFYKKDLKISNVKEMNAAAISKFAQTLTSKTLSNLACEIKDRVVVNPGNTNPSPIGIELVGTGVVGTSRLIYIPMNPNSTCTPNHGGIFVDNVKGCDQKELICSGRTGPQGCFSCHCREACGAASDCATCQ